MQAIDTPYSVLGNVNNIVHAGYHGFIRYISPNTGNFPNKQLTSAEAAAIQSVPGTGIGLVFEDAPTSIGYFTTGQAANDAQQALQLVGALNVPTSVPVFFTVDYDATDDDLAGAILGYFGQVHQLFDVAGILVGIYGSGNSCQAMKSAGVAHYTWLAQSRGWSGYSMWKTSADIVQNPSATVAGLDVDTDYVINEAILWQGA